MILLLMSFLMSIPVSKGSDEDQIAYLRISSIEDINKLKNMGLAEGSGTPEDPYIIENIFLTAIGTQGIFIDKTNFPIILRNIVVIGADVGHGLNIPKDKILYGGIIIYAAENVILENVTIFGNYIGINVYNSQNIVIKDSLVSSCFKGIEISHATQVTLEDLRLFFNTKGVFVDNSNDVSIKSSIVVNSFQYGVQITGSKNMEISDNTIGFAVTGISIENTANIIVTGNVVFDNSLGLFLSKGSSGVDVSRNIFYNNKGFGVSIMPGTEDITVVQNSFFYNRETKDYYEVNVSQAQDVGGTAIWNTSEFGNYWHDWAGTSVDYNNDEILDAAYPIFTLPGTENPPMDWKPLTKPPVIVNMSLVYQIVRDYVYGDILTNISSKISQGSSLPSTMSNSLEDTLISKSLRPIIWGASLVGLGSSLAFIAMALLIRKRFKR